MIRKSYKYIIAITLITLYILGNLQAAFAETKEEIYNNNSEFQVFTDPEEFLKKYSLRKDSKFNPDDYDYFYYNRKISVRVGDDNTIDVSEFIDVYFNTYKSGITRVLPLYSNVAAEHGITEINHINITGIVIEKPYTKKINGDELILTIGDPKSTVTGFQRYNLHYKYDLGRDPLKNADEFYYYLIGMDAERPTLRCQFDITFPKSIDADNVKLLTNRTADKDGYLDFEIDDNKITGETNSFIDSGEILSVNVMLEEGYFDKAGRIYDIPTLISLGSVTVMLIICMFIYYISTKRNSFNHSIEYYPPQMLNSLEASFLRTGRLNDKRVISLLTFLTSRGFVEITELSKGGSGSMSKSNAGFIFTKTKYNGRLKPDEREFYNGLFKTAQPEILPDGTKGEEMVFDDALKRTFYPSIIKIKEQIDKRQGSYAGFFARGGIMARLKYEILVMVLSCLSIALPYCMIYSGTSGDFSLFMLGITSIAVIGPQLIARKMHIVPRFIMYAILDAFVYAGVLGSGTLVISQKAAFITAVTVVSLLSVFSAFIDDIRTAYGTKLYGRIFSFEKTLKLLDKKKIDELTEKDPDYFYRILPFAYALDLSDVWSKKLKLSGKTDAPDWYKLTDESEYSVNKLFYMMSSTTQDMLDSPENKKRNGFYGIDPTVDIGKMFGM